MVCFVTYFLLLWGFSLEISAVNRMISQLAKVPEVASSPWEGLAANWVWDPGAGEVSWVQWCTGSTGNCEQGGEQCRQSMSS